MVSLANLVHLEMQVPSHLVHRRKATVAFLESLEYQDRRETQA